MNLVRVARRWHDGAMPTAAPLESRSPDLEPPDSGTQPAPLPTRLRVAVDHAVTWFAIQFIPARLLAWLIHQRCLWRRTRWQRQAARARSRGQQAS